MPRAPERLVQNLHLLLAEKGLDATALASKARMSQAWISNILNRKRDTPTRNLEKIANALGVPIERLWLPNAGINMEFGAEPPQPALTEDERVLLARWKHLDEGDRAALLRLSRQKPSQETAPDEATPSEAAKKVPRTAQQG